MAGADRWIVQRHQRAGCHEVLIGSNTGFDKNKKLVVHPVNPPVRNRGRIETISQYLLPLFWNQRLRTISWNSAISYGKASATTGLGYLIFEKEKRWLNCLRICKSRYDLKPIHSGEKCCYISKNAYMKKISAAFYCNLVLLLLYWPSTPGAAIDVQHYTFSLALTRYQRRLIKGKAAIEVMVIKDTQTITLDLISKNSNRKGMAVVQVTENGKPLTFTHTNNQSSHSICRTPERTANAKT